MRVQEAATKWRSIVILLVCHRNLMIEKCLYLCGFGDQMAFIHRHSVCAFYNVE